MTSLSISIWIRKKSSPPGPLSLYTLLGDEELEEYHHESRTAPVNKWPEGRYPCTPSVVRFYQGPREKSGDFRVDLSPLLPAFLELNGEQDIKDPKARYFFGDTTALYNKTGYPQQAYITMQGNKLRGELEGEWFRFETLTPRSNVKGMSHASHPWLIHRFDLVCFRNKRTYHKTATPQGQIDYFLLTNEGFGYIPSRYVRVP